MFLQSSSIIHSQRSPILSEIFIKIIPRLDLLSDHIIYNRRVSTFPAKKINRYPKLDTRAGINNIYPDTIRRLEIKIVSLTTIELNNQKNKKKKFESFFNVCQQSKRFLCTSRSKTQSLNPCKISRNRSITSREEFSPSSREIRRDRFEIIFAIGQEIGG